MPVRVLIVDDDALDRDIFKRCLSEGRPGGFCFQEEASGAGAIEACKAFRPDCILLDFSLPDMDGLTILRSLRDGSDGPGYAVVMLTAIGSEQIAVDAMKLGAMDYLSKGPTTAESLYRIVDHAIEKFRLQSEVAKQRERYRILTEALPQLVWTATPEKTIHFANNRLVEYAGKLPAEGLTLESLVHENDREGLAEGWRIAIEGTTGFETEVRVRRASDGMFRWHLLRAVPLCDDHQRASEWLGTLTDIEEQKRTEQVIRQKQKLEGIGLLAGGVAHDFNNLLVGIMGGASFSLEVIPEGHPAREMLETIMRASERAAGLVRQLLAYAGKASAPVESVNLPHLVSDTSELVRATIPRTIQLLVEVDPTLPNITTNPAQMQQIVVNLIVNAVEAIGDATGVVAVKAGLRDVGASDAEGNVLGYQIVPGQYAEVQVIDTGCGMDEETKAKIFDPFFTTKFAGRGLGLAAVQGIVRAAHGSLQVVSTPGKGSTFRILIPVKTMPVAVASAPGTVGMPGQAARLLIIDDERFVRDVVANSLKLHGYAVLTAEDGRQGIEIVRKEAGSLSLVILDQSMPGMSGVEVLQQLKRLAPAIPVVIASGHGEMDMAKRLQGLPVAGYIQKPFSTVTLLDKIRRFISEAKRPHQVDTDGR